MSRKGTGIAAYWLAAVCCIQAQQAESILEKAAAAYEQSNGMAVQFTVNIRSESQGINEYVEGSIQMKGSKFTLFTPDTRTWYDGVTQWTLVMRTGEVNVTRPSGEELQSTNPLLLLQAYRKNFKPSYIGESTASGGKMADDIMLMARGMQDVETVELQLDRATELPVRMTVTMRSKLRSVIRIKQLQTRCNQTDDMFVFPEKEYPDAEIIDLR